MKTGIRIKANFYWLQWILVFCMPRIVINNQIKKIRWGESFIEINPGDYFIEVYFKYLFIPIMKSQINLSIENDNIVNLKYHTPFFVFQNAKLSILGIDQKINPKNNQNKEINAYIAPKEKINDTQTVPPPIPSNDEYYFVIDNEQKGPFNLDEIKTLIKINKIDKKSLYWQKGMSNWECIEENHLMSKYFY